MLPGSRRQFLIAGSAAGLCLAMPVARASGSSVSVSSARLLAAWALPNGNYQAGVLQLVPGKSNTFVTQFALDLPTRPHGLMHLHNDEYLLIARRPGDWMLRLNIQNGSATRIWQESDRHLNGHSAAQGELVYTTETDLLSGHGALAVRDKNSLELIDVWATHGHDPHEMLVMPAGSLGIGQPFLLIANGGIHTHADMGRTRLSEQPMDSSLVALHPRSGSLLGKWVLDDSELSLRHLAAHTSGAVGVALQAQHAADAQRHKSPVFALLTHHGLQTVPASAGMNGYAGDITATPNGFVLSCPKSNVALIFDVQGNLLNTQLAKSACALAALGDQVWLGQQPAQVSNAPVELDNHWLVLHS